MAVFQNPTDRRAGFAGNREFLGAKMHPPLQREGPVPLSVRCSTRSGGPPWAPFPPSGKFRPVSKNPQRWMDFVVTLARDLPHHGGIRETARRSPIPFLEMTTPSYDELLGAIWKLASPSGAGDDGTVRGRPIHWSLFYGGQDVVAGIMVTLEGMPPKAWLVALVGEGEAREVYGCAQGPAHRWSPLETLYPAIRRAHGVLGDAVRIWLESKDCCGRVEPA